MTFEEKSKKAPDAGEKAGKTPTPLPEKLEAVFIDRDGTMCESAAIEYPWQFSPLPGLENMLGDIRSTGAKLFAFTNQSCIARGKDRGYDFAGEFREWGFDDWFICPHDEEDGCSCRKPAPGLLEEAREKYGLRMENCFVIGDRWSDMLPGGRMGCRLLLVLTGRGREALAEDREKWKEYEPDFVAPTLREAALWLKERYGAKAAEKAGGTEETAEVEQAGKKEEELPETLPRDPFILLSYVNTKMRDEGWDLETFCQETGAPRNTLCAALAVIGYAYEEELRRFV